MRVVFAAFLIFLAAIGVQSTYGDFQFSTIGAPTVPGLFLGGFVGDAQGNLYTTAAADNVGSNGSAIVELPKGSTSLETLATLDFGTGYYPWCGLTIDATGDLFGSTYLGGGGPYTNPGTVFELPKGANSVNVLAVFNNTDGFHPQSQPILDASGNLFGTTYTGGSNSDGVLYEVNAVSHTLTAVVSFAGNDGNAPYGSPVLDKNGNLFGTTALGGANNDGVIYKYSTTTSTLSVVASFNGANGSSPIANLIMDSSGNLYGTAETGGAQNDGTIFEVPAGSNVIQILASFNGANGNDPCCGLCRDSAGNLFGTTQTGGSFGDGTAFELKAGSSSVTVLHSFDGFDGFHPIDTLWADTNGDLFGTTAQGGVGFTPTSEGGDGTIFELVNVPEPSACAGLMIGLLAIFNCGRKKPPIRRGRCGPWGNQRGRESN